MYLPEIIPVCGKARHGKDTISDYLVEKYGYEKYAFAGPLKEVCGTLFGFDKDQLYGDKKEVIDKKWGITPRSAFTFIGTDLIRNQIHKLLPDVGKEFWIKCLINNIKEKLEKGVKIVISDVRYENELEALHELFGSFSIKVIRPSLNSENKTLHESEQHILSLKTKCIIVNNSDISTLYERVDNLLKNYSEYHNHVMESRRLS